MRYLIVAVIMFLYTSKKYQWSCNFSLNMTELAKLLCMMTSNASLFDVLSWNFMYEMHQMLGKVLKIKVKPSGVMESA